MIDLVSFAPVKVCCSVLAPERISSMHYAKGYLLVYGLVKVELFDGMHVNGRKNNEEEHHEQRKRDVGFCSALKKPLYQGLSQYKGAHNYS